MSDLARYDLELRLERDSLYDIVVCNILHDMTYCSCFFPIVAGVRPRYDLELRLDRDS